MNESTLQLVTDRLGSLAEPVRVRMLRVLELHELTVGEVASVVQLPQSTVSRHLKMLAETGWLTRRLEGTAAFYRLIADDQPADCRAIWAALRANLNDDASLAEDRRRAEGVIADRRTDSHSFFSRLGGEWDMVRGELFGNRFTPVSLLSLVNPTFRIADVGCGTGNVAEVLCPWAELVIGIDNSTEMLTAARERLQGAANAQFRQGAAERLPLHDGSVDVVTAVLVLHHADDPGGCIREMARVVSPERGGGLVVVVDMLPHTRDEYRRSMGHKHLGFSETQVRAWMSDAGLQNIRFQELPPERSARGPGLFAAIGTIARCETRQASRTKQ